MVVINLTPGPLQPPMQKERLKAAQERKPPTAHQFENLSGT